MAPSKLKVKLVQTEVINNVKLCNAGIRKRADSVCAPHFIEIITQAVLNSINLKDPWILIGGDGRTYSKDIIERIIRVLAGNSVRRVFVGLNGCLATCVASSVLRDRFCHLGFVITGGHHPPGADGFVGLKLISPPGIPMREEVTHKANRIMKNLQSYYACKKLVLDFTEVGESVSVISGKKFSLEVIDVTTPYVEATKKMFDLPSLKYYVHRNLKLLIDCSSGAAGAIAKRLFVDELGIPERRILNAISKEDFGNSHPDPNEIACKSFVKRLQEMEYPFGAVINPDGCRCMIIGEGGFVVPPSDSLAILAAHHKSIPFFQQNKLETVYRTICTSTAVDRVAESLSLLRFEVPVGWDHFSSAMVAGIGKAILFGEESYGLGVSSDRWCGDRDGIWTVLAWLSIMSSLKKSVKEITEDHWKTFGRSFFGRLDFHKLSKKQLDVFLCHLREKNSLRFEKIKSVSFGGTEYIDPFGIDPKLQTEEAKKRNTEIVFDIENYVYPYRFINKSILKDENYQIFRIRLTEDTRLIIRRSESAAGSKILRLYIEHVVESGSEKLLEDRETVLQPFIGAAMKIMQIQDLTSADLSPIFI